MMDKLFLYNLQIPDTGETIFSELTDKTARAWQKRTCRRLLKDRRYREEVKEHILSGNIIVGWANSDELQRNTSEEEFENMVYYVFKGMH